MEIDLTAQESEAVQKALRSYLSDLRMEISDTDNPQYKRELRDERADLESALAKLDGGAIEPERGSDATGTTVAAGDEIATVRVVRLWWRRRY